MARDATTAGENGGASTEEFVIELRKCIERAKPHWLIAAETRLREARMARAAHQEKLDSVMRELWELISNRDARGNRADLQKELGKLQKQMEPLQRAVGEGRREVATLRERNAHAFASALRPHVGKIAKAYVDVMYDLRSVEAFLQAVEAAYASQGQSVLLPWDPVGRAHAVLRLERVAERLTEVAEAGDA